MKNILVLSTDEQFLQRLRAELYQDDLIVSVLRQAVNLPKALDNVAPDLLLIDFFLNDVNGGAICHQLKSDSLTRDVPIILLADEPQITRFSNKFGCNAMLSKSSRPGLLAETIELLLADAPSLKAS